MKKNVGKLLAVAVIATATPAAAGPSHVHERPHVDPWAPKPTVTTVPANMPTEFRAAQAELLARGVLAAIGVRTLRSGAPACGNVQSKVRRPCEPEQQPVRTAQNTEKQ